jgi:hypothetical protein
MEKQHAQGTALHFFIIFIEKKTILHKQYTKQQISESSLEIEMIPKNK